MRKVCIAAGGGWPTRFASRSLGKPIPAPPERPGVEDLDDIGCRDRPSGVPPGTKQVGPRVWCVHQATLIPDALHYGLDRQFLGDSVAQEQPDQFGAAPAADFLTYDDAIWIESLGAESALNFTMVRDRDPVDTHFRRSLDQLRRGGPRVGREAGVGMEIDP
jgi:hypothetical protein